MTAKGLQLFTIELNSKESRQLGTKLNRTASQQRQQNHQTTMNRKERKNKLKRGKALSLRLIFHPTRIFRLRNMTIIFVKEA